MNIQWSACSKFKYCNPYLHVVQRTQGYCHSMTNVMAFLNSPYDCLMPLHIFNQLHLSAICSVQYSASWPCKSWHFDHILVPWYPNTWTYHYFQTPLQPDIMKFTRFCYRLFLKLVFYLFFRKMQTAVDVMHLQTDIHILKTLNGFSENLYLWCKQHWSSPAIHQWH